MAAASSVAAKLAVYLLGNDRHVHPRRPAAEVERNDADHISGRVAGCGNTGKYPYRRVHIRSREDGLSGACEIHRTAVIEGISVKTDRYRLYRFTRRKARHVHIETRQRGTESETGRQRKLRSPRLDGILARRVSHSEGIIRQVSVLYGGQPESECPRPQVGIHAGHSRPVIVGVYFGQYRSLLADSHTPRKVGNGPRLRRPELKRPVCPAGSIRETDHDYVVLFPQGGQIVV